MAQNQYHLLATKRFLPLFITQFFNAFNDNVFKNALIVLVTYKIATSISAQQFLIAVIGAIFILPFFLFSALAGQIADKFEKSILIRYIKFTEIIFMVIASIGFYFNNLYLLLLTLFFLGSHSTFFGPIKYSILPDHLQRNELIGGNGLIEAGTFIAILVGSILGGSLILAQNGIMLISLALITVSLLGFMSSFFIPKTIRGQPNLILSFNLFKQTRRIISLTRQDKQIFLAVLGISWFWFIGSTFITQLPSFTKEFLAANASVFTLFLTTFSVGIGTGSLLCNKLLKGKITTKYVPLSVFAMSIFIVDMALISPGPAQVLTDLISFTSFFKSIVNIRILFDLFFMAVFGGLFLVPLYALIQEKSDEAIRSRIIGCNNIINALFMVGSALFIILLTSLRITIPQIFFIVAVLNFFVAIYICKLLPEAMVQSFLKWLLQFFYKVDVKGLENYHQAGDRVLIVANHTSFLDAALLAAFIPNRLTFAINTDVAKKWWLRPITKIIDTISLDPTQPLAIKILIKKIRSNCQCVIFPEGRITVTGSLMKVYDGPGMVADQAKATVLPIRIDGAQYSYFSRLKNKVKLKWFPKITITILPPHHFKLDSDIKGRQRRQRIGQELYNIMSNMMFETSDYRKTLFNSLLDAKRIHSGKHIILEDVNRKPLNYSSLIRACFVLGCHFQKKLLQHNNVAILLPNISYNVITFFALQSIQRTPVMLNYTFGPNVLITACYTAGVKEIISSRQFIATAKLVSVVDELVAAGITMHYIEDIKKDLDTFTQLHGLLKSILPSFFYKPSSGEENTPAVILFTSGSEGTAKGVALSHQNIQANRFQLSARIDFAANDIIFNALPMFHSFGLSAGTLLPILFGMKTFLYPSPLHFRIIPELIYDINATVTFGTDTFLRGYARFANPYDFYSVRYVLAGAEKLKKETQTLWNDKFGIRILEGYGATETSPVLSINTPMHYKAGTVGQLLPNIQYRLEPIPDLATGGRLYVKGPNVMLGYLLATDPLKLHPLSDGWYDTGDIVDIDADGYIRILGRAKRFAKIGGEMVSLTAIEHYIADHWPLHQHAVIAIADAQKGEQLLLFTTYTDLTRTMLLDLSKQIGIAEIQVPKKIIHLEQMPLLATGKINYQDLQAYILKND